MKFVYSIIIFISVIFLYSCSKLNEPIPAAPEITIHETGILDKDSPNFHGTLVRENEWDLQICQGCHSADYSGGVAGSSCLTCHSQPEGPEACNTCHGDFDNPDIIAPPRDINGNISTDSTGVGAHFHHLYDNELGSEIECSTCHVVPEDYFDDGHVDTDLPAEVVLGNLAVHNIAGDASYDYSTATCSNTYCHGNWEFLKDSSDFQFMYTADKMAGNNQSVIFNQVDGTQALCGSCHGLPPDGHLQSALSSCGLVGCHEGIVDSDGNIINTEKHINGEKNVRGN